MGIQDTKNRLPYRQINMFERQGAHIIDAANPLFLSGLRHAKARFAGEHEAAIAEFQAILHSLLQHFDAKRLKMAFDGRRWPHKEHEDQRRSLVHEKAIAWVEAALQAGAEPRLSDYQACVRNTPLLILLAKKLCEAEQVACVVAPYEADPQLVAEALATGCAIISYDTDMLALGAPTWIAPEPGGWLTGQARLYELPKMEPSADFPLVAPVLRWGHRALQFYAVLRGCDFTEERCGVTGCGFDATVGVLSAVQELTVEAVVEALAAAGRCPRLDSYERELVASGGLRDRLVEELEGYQLAPFYDANGATRLLATRGSVLEPATHASREHMRGESDPRTGEGLSDEVAAVVEGVRPSEVRMPMRPDPATVAGAQLPNDPERCSVEQLKAFICSHGASCTGELKPELIEIAYDYLQLGEEVDLHVVDTQSRVLTMDIPKMVTQRGMQMPKLLDAILQGTSTELPAPARALLEEAVSLYEQDLVTEEADEVALVGAQLEPQVLEQFYSVLSHDRVNMKAIRDSLSKLSESILRYHAYSKPAVDVTTHPPLSLFHAHTCLTTTTIAC